MNQCSTTIARFLLGSLLLAACSRPTAYFQPRQHGATNAPAPAAELPLTPPVAEQPLTPSLVEATRALDQLEALVVSRPGKLAQPKLLQQRLARMRTALSQSSAKARSASPAAPRKLRLLERVMVRKLNKKISKQLAPDQPHKAMASKDILVARTLLIIVGGLLLLLLTAGART